MAQFAKQTPRMRRRISISSRSSVITSNIFYKLFVGKKPRALFGTLLLLLLAPALAVLAQPPIPTEYRSLYSTLEADMNTFEQTLDARMPAYNTRVDMFAELLTANTNQGQSMLSPYAIDTVRTNLDRLVDIGVTGVVFPVSFPLLLPEYMSNASDYLTFYMNVAQEVRQRNLKMVIKLHSIFPRALPEFDFNYDNLTFAKYKYGKLRMAQTIIDNLQPDYLALISEPATEASVTGLAELNNPTNVKEFVTFTLARLNKNTTLIGAGSGTWESPELIRDHLAGLAELDFIDIHVYPINNFSQVNVDFLAQLLTYIDNARSVDPNKKVVIAEAWLYKASDSETATVNSAIDPRLFARDIYSFWKPLDQAFLRIITKAASLKKLTFVSPFWSRHFFAYADYSLELAEMPPSRVLKYADELALNNMLNKINSSTGTYYTQLINEYGVVRPTLPPPARSTIQVFAEGTQAFGEYPTMVLSINDLPVKIYTNVSSYRTYMYRHSTRITPDQVKLSYVNDAKDRSTGDDRNLRVDKIIVDGATYETESGNTFSSSSCYTGFARSEWMRCNGYFLYDQLPSSPFPTPLPDRTAPIITLLRPANNMIVAPGTTVVVDVDAFDLNGVTKVEFTLDGGIRCVDGFSPYTCSIIIPSFGTGPYTIQAQAYDTTGNPAAKSIVVHTR